MDAALLRLLCYDGVWLRGAPSIRRGGSRQNNLAHAQRQHHLT